jgi:hypothetical protein
MLFVLFAWFLSMSLSFEEAGSDSNLGYSVGVPG